MTFGWMRSLTRRADRTPSEGQRVAEFATMQAIATFLTSDGPVPKLSLPEGHRLDGLSGVRAWRIVSAQVDALANKEGRGTAAIETVRQSLLAELDQAGEPDGPSPRQAAHLRTLLAFATGLWAFRSAEAQGAGSPETSAKVSDAAERAACMLRSEPYLRLLQAETLWLLGEMDKVSALLAPMAKAPWLGGWSDAFVQMLQRCQEPSALLPPGPGKDRLLAMSALPRWLEKAGSDLPRFLLQEAVGREPLAVASPTFELIVSAKDWSNGRGAQELIGSEDVEAEPTIRALRTALRRRFGVVLWSVGIRDDALLPAGQASVAIYGRTAATTEVADLAQSAGAERWWSGATGAPPALRALLVAALRNLARLEPAAPDMSREAAEARALMLADRMPYGQLAERLRELLTAGVEPVSAVAALRQRSPEDAERTPLWGNEEGRTLLLLDRTTENAFQACVVPNMGLAAPAQLFVTLTKTLRKRFDLEQHGQAQVTLIVRDAMLRPLMRSLLQDNFSDLPVLALAEVDFGKRHTLLPLEAEVAP